MHRSSCWINEDQCFTLCSQALLHADSLQRTHQVALALQQRAELLVRSVILCTEHEVINLSKG